MTDHTARLEELRAELRAERISWGELAELQSLAEFIPAGDVELLEAAGVPEFPPEDDSSALRVDLTPTQIRAVLEAIAPIVGDSKGPLEEAERELDSALLAHENEERTNA